MNTKTKPTQRPVSINEVIKGIYGFCPHCGDLCHLKPNGYSHKPEVKLRIEKLGERGQYWVDWHDYVVESRVRQGHTCNGSNAVPTRLVKEEVKKEEKK